MPPGFESDAAYEEWERWGPAYMRLAERLVAPHAAGGGLRTLALGVQFTMRGVIGPSPGLVAAELAFARRVFAAPLPALERLDLEFRCTDDANGAAATDGDCLEALRPLAHLDLPRLVRLRLAFSCFKNADRVGDVLRWVGEAALPALCRLAVDENCGKYDTAWMLEFAKPRWAALDSLDLSVGLLDADRKSEAPAALAPTLAPTLRHLTLPWDLTSEDATGGLFAVEWPQLRSLHAMGVDGAGVATPWGQAQLPRLERLVLPAADKPAFWKSCATWAPAAPRLRVLELTSCFCGNFACGVAGCRHPRTLECLAALRASSYSQSLEGTGSGTPATAASTRATSPPSPPAPGAAAATRPGRESRAHTWRGGRMGAPGWPACGAAGSRRSGRGCAGRPAARASGRPRRRPPGGSTAPPTTAGSCPRPAGRARRRPRARGPRRSGRRRPGRCRCRARPRRAGTRAGAGRPPSASDPPAIGPPCVRAASPRNQNAINICCQTCAAQAHALLRRLV
jgi:hypothetical protein